MLSTLVVHTQIVRQTSGKDWLGSACTYCIKYNTYIPVMYVDSVDRYPRTHARKPASSPMLVRYYYMYICRYVCMYVPAKAQTHLAGLDTIETSEFAMAINNLILQMCK